MSMRNMFGFNILGNNSSGMVVSDDYFGNLLCVPKAKTLHKIRPY